MEGLIGIYYFSVRARARVRVPLPYRERAAGSPPYRRDRPDRGFDPSDLPSPLRNILPCMLPDAVGGAFGMVRDYLAP